ncbi:hypothetical protein [Oceanospirillum multiglobuliferum]|uniref:hypothetical protein n=1 Tax=Oceanospirillum multiglobuliferum TaxID=64969 RepID=UPI0014754879|nr:hypothetical protein [Oceanospirillum multiglobuliferum]
MLVAFYDPEPTSKLWLLVASGAVLAVSGGFSAVHVLTKKKPPKIKISPEGFEIDWA